MKVIVNNDALEEAIKIMLEKRSIQSTRIDTIAGDIEADIDEDEEPIQASDMMSTQLAVEKPPVEDPNFVPATTGELSRAASVMSNEVPDDQIDFFYRKLHDLLDQALDRHGTDDSEPTVQDEEEEAVEARNVASPEAEDVIQELKFRKAVSLILEEDDTFTEDELDRIIVAAEEIIEFLESINFGYSTRERVLQSGEIQTYFADGLMRRALDDILDQNDMLPEIAAAIDDLSDDEKAQVLSNVRDHYMELSRTIPSQRDVDQLNANKEVDMIANSMLKSMSPEDVAQFLLKKAKSEKDPLKKNAYNNIANLLLKKGKEVFVDPGYYGEEEKEQAQLSPEDAAQVAQEKLERDLKKLDALAAVYGFSAASGFRQWRMKFPEPIFKAILGSEGGISEYRGFSNEAYKSMILAMRKISEMVGLLVEEVEDDLEENPDDGDLEQMVEALQKIDIELLEIRETATEDGDFDVNMVLNTLGGKVLRQIFSTHFYKPPFTEYARTIKKYMTNFLTGQGIDQKTASTFAKMFNGEVDLLPYNSEKRQMNKIRLGGLTPQIYRSALSEAQKFNRVFFGKDNREKISASFEKTLRDPQKITRAIFNAIPDVLDWSVIEKENPQLQVTETRIRDIISGII